MADYSEAGIAVKAQMAAERRLEETMILSKIYKVTRNSDLTEGRGPDVLVGYYKTAAEALAVARDRSNWTMGTSPACVITVMDTTRKLLEFRPFYAYGKFADGTPDRELDPEYEEYLRLRRKFE